MFLWLVLFLLGNGSRNGYRLFFSDIKVQPKTYRVRTCKTSGPEGQLDNKQQKLCEPSLSQVKTKIKEDLFSPPGSSEVGVELFKKLSL